MTLLLLLVVCIHTTHSQPVTINPLSPSFCLSPSAETSILASLKNMEMRLNKNGLAATSAASSDIEGRNEAPRFICLNNQEIQDCGNIKASPEQKTGKYIACIWGNPIEIFCDFDTPNGPWTVIQRRRDGSINFYRKLSEYVAGFGEIEGEFFMGLSTLNLLTARYGTYVLRIELTDEGDRDTFAEYTKFVVHTERTKHFIEFASYSGDAGDGMFDQNKQTFSTFDDDKVPNCAKQQISAWWFNSCNATNLNGLYHETPPFSSVPEAVPWMQWTTTASRTFLKRTEMKIKR